MLKVWKKSWEPFGSCLLNSTANPARLGWKWAGLAVLFSRQLPNGSHDFFQTFSTYFFDGFSKIPQTTIALPFLTHNNSAIGGVNSNPPMYNLVNKLLSDEIHAKCTFVPIFCSMVTIENSLYYLWSHIWLRNNPLELVSAFFLNVRQIKILGNSGVKNWVFLLHVSKD